MWTEAPMYEKLIHKTNSGLALVVRKPKIQKVKEKKKKKNNNKSWEHQSK